MELGRPAALLVPAGAHLAKWAVSYGKLAYRKNPCVQGPGLTRQIEGNTALG